MNQGGKVTYPNDGGPAFPSGKNTTVDQPPEEPFYLGMSLRAWLAGKAISVIRPVYEVTSDPHKSKDGQLPPFSKIRAAVIAREACEVADALIAELEGKDAEIQAPDAEAFKFELEQKVRLKQREPYRFDENEGVVKTRKLRDGLPAYELLVFVKGHRGSSWWSEDKLESAPKFMPVKEGEAKFKKGDLVWVKPAADGLFANVVAVVETVVRDVPLKAWKYEVSIPHGSGRAFRFIYEHWLESQEERAGEE